MTDREVISLKEFFLSKIDDLESKLQVRFDLTDKSVIATAEALQSKLDDMNKFRSQINEERGLYARKDEMELRLNVITDKLDQIASCVNTTTGRTAGKEWAIGIFIAIALSLAGFIITLLKG